MFRKIIAGTAVAGALTLGAAGIAGASTPTTGPTGGTPSAAVCAKLPAIQAKVQTLEAKVDRRGCPRPQAREAKAKAAGHTKLRRRHRQPDHQGPGP